MQYYSIREDEKPERQRIYHTNLRCPTGRRIALQDRREGTNGYRLCDDCVTLDKRPGRSRPGVIISGSC